MQFFKSLPPWARGVVIIMIIVILVIIGIYINNKVKNAQKTKDSKAEVDAAADELAKAKNAGIVETFSDAEFQTKCNAIIEAANGCDPGEQGAQAIMAVIYSLQNQADWWKLLKTFGTRTWDDCGWGTGDVSGSLTTLLINELGANQLSEVRRHIGQFNVSF